MIPDSGARPWADSERRSEATDRRGDAAGDPAPDPAGDPTGAAPGLDESGEPVFEIQPPARRGTLRIVGPGRKERSYLEDLGRLKREVEESARALEVANLVERGAARAMDRLEGEIASRRRDHQALLQDQRRLILALGAVQRENEILREKLVLRATAPRALGPARREKRASFWSRVFARRKE